MATHWRQELQACLCIGTVDACVLLKVLGHIKEPMQCCFMCFPVQCASEFCHAASLSLTNHAHAVAGKIVGLIFAVVGPSVATILWLSITFSYRQEKAVIINGVQQQIATSDITGNSAALIGSTQGASHPQERKQSAKPTYTLPVDTAFDLHGLSPIGPEDTTQQLSNRSASGTSPNVDRAASMGSSASRSPSEMQGVSLLRQLRGAAATDKDATTEVLNSSGPVQLLATSHAHLH